MNQVKAPPSFTVGNAVGSSGAKYWTFDRFMMKAYMFNLPFHLHSVGLSLESKG